MDVLVLAKNVVHLLQLRRLRVPADVEKRIDEIKTIQLPMHKSENWPFLAE